MNARILFLNAFFLISLVLTSGCQNQFRLPVGKSSTPKTPKVDEPAPPSNEMTNKPQPVEGTGNGNGGIDPDNLELASSTAEDARTNNTFGQLYSQFRSYNQNKFETGKNSFAENTMDVLSETLWKELNLHSQFTLLAKNTVFHSNGNKSPDHLLMYVSQSEQGVLLINLMILPFGHHPIDDVFTALKAGNSVIFPHATLPNKKNNSRKESFVVNLDALRSDKNIILPYLSLDEPVIFSDTNFINLSEDAQFHTNTPKATTKANKVLAICKDPNLNKELALSGDAQHEATGCEMEYVDFTLHFGFTKEKNLLIVFESGSPSTIQMIAEIPLKDPSIYLDNRSPFRAQPK